MADECRLPIADNLKQGLHTFLQQVKTTSQKNNVPKYFGEFAKQLEALSVTILNSITALEKENQALQGQVHVQKAVSDALKKDHVKLTDDLDDLQQYGRRTNLLIHGVEEEKGEVNTDNKVLNIIKEKLG